MSSGPRTEGKREGKRCRVAASSTPAFPAFEIQNGNSLHSRPDLTLIEAVSPPSSRRSDVKVTDRLVCPTLVIHFCAIFNFTPLLLN